MDVGDDVVESGADAKIDESIANSLLDDTLKTILTKVVRDTFF